MPEKPEKCEDHVGEEARDQKTADTPVMSDEVIRVMTGHFSANLIIDPLDGRILAANPPARELLSLEAEDLPTVADLSEKGFPPLDWFARFRDIQPAVQRFIFHGTSGEIRQLRLSGGRMTCADRDIFTAQLEDISSRLAFHSFLVEHGKSNGTRVLDNNQLLRFALQLYHRILPVQASAAYFPGFQSDIVYHPEDADPELCEQLQHVLNTRGRDGTGDDLTILPVNEDGDRILYIPSSPAEHQSGIIAMFLRAGHSLQRSSLPPIQYLSQLIGEQLIRNEAKKTIRMRFIRDWQFQRNTKLSIAVLDNEDRIIEANQQLLDMLEIESGLIVGRRLDELRNLIPIPQDMEKSRTVPIMYSYIRPDQTPVYFNTTYIALGDDADRAGSCLLILWDVTAVRRLEDELILTKNQTEAATRSKGDFISNISHELRTPLNGINGMAQLLEDTQLDPDQREMVETLRLSVENLNNLIQDLLDFSRLDAGKLKIDEDFFDVYQVLSQVVRNHLIDAREKGLEINLIQAEPGLQYFSDAMRFQQIINNLLANAVKFTDRGGAEISYGIDGNHLTVKVKDTGIGIPQKLQRQIFESFTQLEHTYTKYRQGLGLGLAICQRLSVLMGGELSLESRAGEGSEFILKLPLRQGNIRYLDGENRPSRRSDDRQMNRFNGLRVLVAEDDFLNRKTLVRFLKMQGCLVSPARDGLEAEHLLKTMDFDLLVFDITMPELTGQELTRLVRQDKANTRNDIPILGVTAHVFPGEIQEFLDAGMDAVLTKPFVPSQLYERMDSILTPAENSTLDRTL
jgi:signal transduction histidine kinase/AmiR/NasT family two-component response regulator